MAHARGYGHGRGSRGRVTGEGVLRLRVCPFEIRVIGAAFGRGGSGGTVKHFEGGVNAGRGVDKALVVSARSRLLGLTAIMFRKESRTLL